MNPSSLRLALPNSSNMWREDENLTHFKRAITLWKRSHMIACSSRQFILFLCSSLHKKDFNVKFSCCLGNDSPTQPPLFYVPFSEQSQLFWLRRWVHNKIPNNLGEDLKASSHSILNIGLENTSVFLQNDLTSTPWSHQMFGMSLVQWAHSFWLRLHKQLLATCRKLHSATRKAFSVLNLPFLYNSSIAV